MKIGNTEMPSRAYVGRFNFKGVDRGKRVGELSGGERGRLHWRNCCRSAVTSCCSMNQPTTWISKPCARWKTPCWSSRAARWLSRTTAGSLTVLPPTFWTTGMKVRLSSSKVTLPSTKSTRNALSAPTRWSRSESSTNVSRNKTQKGNASCLFIVCSLSHWERVGVRATARRAPTPARPSAVSPARRSAGTGHRSPTPSHERIRSRSLSAAIPATTETLYDPPSSQDCAVHRPPTGYCSPAGSPRSKRYSSISACTNGCSRPSYFRQKA